MQRAATFRWAALNLHHPPIRGEAGETFLRDESGLELRLEFHQTLQGFEEILKGVRWQHDRVTPSADILGYFQEPAALVFFEIEKEDFPFDRHFFRSDRVGTHSFTWIVIHHIQTTAVFFGRTKPEWMWTERPKGRVISRTRNPPSH